MSLPVLTYLTIVIAAMAIAHSIETITGWSIKKFVRTESPRVSWRVGYPASGCLSGVV